MCTLHDRNTPSRPISSVPPTLREAVRCRNYNCCGTQSHHTTMIDTLEFDRRTPRTAVLLEKVFFSGLHVSLTMMLFVMHLPSGKIRNSHYKVHRCFIQVCVNAIYFCGAGREYSEGLNQWFGLTVSRFRGKHARAGGTETSTQDGRR